MVVTNGFLRDRDNQDINHPVITRRVKTSFDPIANKMSIEDTDVKTELYAMLFQVMSDINLDSITSLRDNLHKNDYHPLDRNDTPEFLKVLIHQLSPESVFSEVGEPDAWYRGNRLLIYLNPAFVVRKRVDGTLKAVEQIIENIEETGDVPPHLKDIVSGGRIRIPEDDHEETIEEKLASVGGESVDILLSKEANKEQLEIAQRIELYNAVLVQGPPGTGKTHTIANLMGHFLAHGSTGDPHRAFRHKGSCRRNFRQDETDAGAAKAAKTAGAGTLGGYVHEGRRKGAYPGRLRIRSCRERFERA